MRILITGHKGFIGSRLFSLLEAKGFDLLEGHNVLFIDLESKEEFDLIYHLAAQTSVQGSIVNPIKDAETNILGTLKLIKKFSGFQ